MTADAALVLHEVLRQKAPTTLLITEAWSSLINGSALLWLLGDRRRIRPTAWLFFRKAEPKRENEEIPFDFDAIFGGPPGIDLQSFAPIRPLSDFMNPISVATLASL
jgi:hypothetical protein